MAMALALMPPKLDQQFQPLRRLYKRQKLGSGHQRFGWSHLAQWCMAMLASWKSIRFFYTHCQQYSWSTHSLKFILFERSLVWWKASKWTMCFKRCSAPNDHNQQGTAYLPILVIVWFTMEMAHFWQSPWESGVNTNTIQRIKVTNKCLHRLATRIFIGIMDAEYPAPLLVGAWLVLLLQEVNFEFTRFTGDGRPQDGRGGAEGFLPKAIKP